jgi:type IVB pilus formation R64 PilN family outer membrane protein
MPTQLMTMPRFKFIPVALASTLLLNGCAVAPADVSSAKDEALQTGADKIAKGKNQLKQENRITLMTGNFIGDNPIELPYAAALPALFFEKITIRSKTNEFGTVTQAAKNIALATGLSTRVNPDVLTPVAAGGAGTGAPSAGGSPNAMGPRDLTSVRLDYHGTLLAYVREVANTAGLEWEFKDGAISFFKLITKTFVLSNASPGDIDIADTMNKGGQASTGQTGSATASNSGSFNSTSSVGIKGTYSIWKALKPALDATLSPVGKLSINEGTGTITVTDTKDAVAKVGRIVETENNILGKQVSIEVRIIRVDITKQTQLGINLNTVYSLLKNGDQTLSAATQSQATQVNGTAGTLTFAVTDPASRFKGSSAGLQALNQFGDVLSDTSATVITTNRVPVMTGSFNTRGFLAQTTPASGGVAGGTGVPGLTPGSTTVGSFMRVMPTIRENNTILINMSVDISDLLGFGSASTGAGATLQQIQWANTAGTKTISNLVLNQGEAMVIAGIGADAVNATADNGIAGASSNATKTKNLFVVVVTPRIMKGL